MKKLRITEIFNSYQGEGFFLGYPVIFIRFAGCNLWSGKEKDREDAVCKFCDTQFLKYTEFSLDDLISHLKKIRRQTSIDRLVLTGGEPFLQLDINILCQLKKVFSYIHIETNGTIDKIPVDKKKLFWISVSPKKNSNWQKIKYVDEVKLVYPNSYKKEDLWKEQDFEEIADYFIFNSYKKPSFYIMPLDARYLPKTLQVTREDIWQVINEQLASGIWRLGVQAHKVWGIK